MSRLALLAVVLFLAPPLTSSSPAATACATQILRDWSADGRVTKTYALPCYEAAIDALPTDIRDYTNAEDVITRALSSAVRSDGPAGAAAKPVPTSGQGAEPVLFAVAGLAIVVLAAGGTGYVLRRRRSHQGLVQ
jgi:LPXTG-motif cell wall-anchored protein